MDEQSSGGNTGGAAPATFAEAFATSADSPSAEPVQQDTTLPAAAQPDSASTETPQQGERSPFIPRDRFDEVVQARQKAEREYAEYKQRTGWAENQVLREAAERIARHQGNVQGLLDEIVDDLAQTPDGQQTLRSFLGRKFGGLRQRSSEPVGPPEPDVVITDANGQPVGKTYSDAALAKRDAYLEQQLLQKIEQAYGPKLKTLDTIEAERKTAAATAEAQAFAGSFMQELQALPGFTLEKHGPAIAAELKSLQLRPDAHPAEVNAAAYRAYVKVVLPTLGATAQSQLLDSLQQKAAASTAVNPSGAAPTSRTSPKSFHDSTLVW